MNLIAFKITGLVVIILKEELPNQKKKGWASRFQNIIYLSRSSHRRCSVRKRVLRNFAKKESDRLSYN